MPERERFKKGIKKLPKNWNLRGVKGIKEENSTSLQMFLTDRRQLFSKNLIR